MAQDFQSLTDVDRQFSVALQSGGVDRWHLRRLPEVRPSGSSSNMAQVKPRFNFGRQLQNSGGFSLKGQGPRDGAPEDLLCHFRKSGGDFTQGWDHCTGPLKGCQGDKHPCEKNLGIESTLQIFLQCAWTMDPTLSPAHRVAQPSLTMGSHWKGSWRALLAFRLGT